MVMMIDGITLRYQYQNMASLEISNNQIDGFSWKNHWTSSSQVFFLNK